MLASSLRAGMMTDTFGVSAPARADAVSSEAERALERVRNSAAKGSLGASRAGDPAVPVGVDDAGIAGFMASNFVL